MSNHFPVLPGDVAVAGIQYLSRITWSGGTASSLSPLHFSGGDVILNNDDQFVLNYVVVFSAPGAYGSFDQDSFETGFKASVTAICTRLATDLGVTLATVQAQTTITRNWQFGSPTVAGWDFGTTEALAYP